MNEVGKQISTEWARITEYAKNLDGRPESLEQRDPQRPATTENGSGERLKAAILLVRAEVAKKLGIRGRKPADQLSDS